MPFVVHAAIKPNATFVPLLRNSPGCSPDAKEETLVQLIVPGSKPSPPKPHRYGSSETPTAHRAFVPDFLLQPAIPASLPPPSIAPGIASEPASRFFCHAATPEPQCPQPSSNPVCSPEANALPAFRRPRSELNLPHPGIALRKSSCVRGIASRSTAETELRSTQSRLNQRPCPRRKARTAAVHLRVQPGVPSP
jgi:hypothetical protein